MISPHVKGHQSFEMTGRKGSLIAIRKRCHMSQISYDSTLETSERILSNFDQQQQIIAKSEGEGFGGGISATRWADQYPDVDALRRSVMILSSQAQKVMLGICADDAAEGVKILKEWVENLGLPKGRLHGMDLQGVPLNMDDFGAVYIKYNSAGSEIAQPGDAMLNGYSGTFRGVYFNPLLPDGKFRQYAVLPRKMFESKTSTQSTSVRKPSSSEADRILVQERLRALEPILMPLGASVTVKAADLTIGKVTLGYRGPKQLVLGVEEWLRTSSGLPEYLRFKIDTEAPQEDLNQ